MNRTDLQWLLRIKSSVCLCLMYQMYSNIDNERNDNHYFHSVSWNYQALELKSLYENYRKI